MGTPAKIQPVDSSSVNASFEDARSLFIFIDPRIFNFILQHPCLPSGQAKKELPDNECWFICSGTCAFDKVITLGSIGFQEPIGAIKNYGAIVRTAIKQSRFPQQSCELPDFVIG